LYYSLVKQSLEKEFLISLNCVLGLTAERVDAMNNFFRGWFAVVGAAICGINLLFAAPATLLFEDDFNRGIPGWTQVQPAGTYIGSSKEF
jgi:hypothetical protein